MKCDICHESRDSWFGIADHMMTAHGWRTYASGNPWCPRCKLSFMTVSELAEHIEYDVVFRSLRGMADGS